MNGHDSPGRNVSSIPSAGKASLNPSNTPPGPPRNPAISERNRNVTASRTTRVAVNSILHAAVALFMRDPSELTANASQVSPTENVLITGVPMTTGPVLHQTPTGFSPPFLLSV
jgi:hypothetical protein